MDQGDGSAGADPPRRDETPPAGTEPSRGALVGQLVVVALVAVLPVTMLVRLLSRVARDLAAGRGLARLAFEDVRGWLVVVGAPFALAVLAYVLMVRLRRRRQPWTGAERLLLIAGQAVGYTAAVVLGVSLLVTVAPFAVLPVAAIVVGLNQLPYIQARWRAEGSGPEEPVTPPRR